MKFYQITDLHYYPAKLLKAQGKEWINRAMYDQKCIAESEAILDATIQMLLDDKEIGIVLIIPAAFILSRFFGAVGVWHAFWVAELLTAVISLFVYKKSVKLNK